MSELAHNVLYSRHRTERFPFGIFQLIDGPHVNWISRRADMFWIVCRISIRRPICRWHMSVAQMDMYPTIDHVNFVWVFLERAFSPDEAETLLVWSSYQQPIF